ncbi:unnamed protein product [Malus baccata var. baccata]
MGKKVSQQTASLKISKKENKEFNSLIRLLRPKVYITDSSSFKRLVQDLTGNGASNPITTSSSLLHPQKKHRPPVEEEKEIPVVVDIEPEGSVDVSTDTSFNSSELCSQVFINDQEFKQLCYQIFADDHTTTTTSTSEGSAEEQLLVDDMLPFQDLEQWLNLDTVYDQPNHDPFSHYGYAQIDQQVSIYDYELSGLIRLLRPKVYITDSSSFKRLVQDLTGNGTSNPITTSSSLSHPPKKHRPPVEEEKEIPVVVDIEPEGSVDVSADASFDSLELCSQVFMNDQEFNQLSYQIYADDHTTTTTSTLDGSAEEQLLVDDMLPFQELEQLLNLDAVYHQPNHDPFSNYDYTQFDQQLLHDRTHDSNYQCHIYPAPTSIHCQFLPMHYLLRSSFDPDRDILYSRAYQKSDNNKNTW